MAATHFSLFALDRKNLRHSRVIYPYGRDGTRNIRGGSCLVLLILWDILGPCLSHGDTLKSVAQYRATKRWPSLNCICNPAFSAGIAFAAFFILFVPCPQHHKPLNACLIYSRNRLRGMSTSRRPNGAIAESAPWPPQWCP